MISLNTILFFIVGLIAGSFLNVVIFRIDDLKSILYTRSRCRSCQQTIKWYDLIPLLSFIILRGRCRNCGQKISWQYPIVEFSVGVLFAYLFLMFGLSWNVLFYIVVFSLLTVVFVYDIKTQTVPDTFVWIAVLISAIGGWYFGAFGILPMIWGGLIGGGFLGALAYFSKEKWMGYGDIGIGLTLGFLTGFPGALFGLFFAFVLGSIVGLLYIYLRKKSFQTAIPFGPFLILGALITLTYGQLLINWYLNIISQR